MSFPYAPITNSVPWTQTIVGFNQLIFSTTWSANEASDVLVYSRVMGVPASDVLQQIPFNQYTVQFIGPDNIVQVTFLPQYQQPQYNIVTIVRATPSQFINLYTNTNFTPSMLNGDFETLTLVDQQNQLYWQQIVPRYNVSDSVNVPVDTVLPVLGANEFWIKNSTNTAFIPATIGDSGQFPVLGPFVLYAANSDYPSGFNLGTLGSGLLAQNTSLGISTPYIIPFPIEVNEGGTGLQSFTPNGMILGGTTPTSPLVSVSDLGAAGEVWTSNGPSLPPSYQPPVVSSGLPIGTKIDFCGTVAPVDYLICDGSAYSRVTYAALFTVIGTTWGIGDGSTTFNVPNFQGVVTAGAGGTLLSGSDTVGLSGGSKTVTLVANNLPSHIHSMINGNGVSTGSGTIGIIQSSANTTTVSTGTNTTTNTGVSIVQPTAITLTCIKYQ